MKHYDKYVRYRFNSGIASVRRKTPWRLASLATPAVPNVSLSSSSIDTSAAASGTAGIAKKFATEVAKEYAWDQAKAGGKEVLASVVSSDAMADGTGLLLGM